MKFYSVIVMLLITTITTWADCTFKIINYSNAAVATQIGFYNSQSRTILIKPLSTMIQTITSEMNCITTSVAGLGKAYILFPKDPQQAGANYSPADNNIILKGKFSNLGAGARLKADDGLSLWLTSSEKAINANKFEVELLVTSRPSSYSAGTQ